mgnify:CR=1 FL=1
MAHPKLAALAAGLCLFVTMAIAAEEETTTPAGYTRTGIFENCIRTQQIRTSRILNKNQILFEMAGGEAWLNEPKNCPGLSKSLALAYDATTGQLCTTTIVTLVDPGSAVATRGGCGLEKFERLERPVAP